MVGKENFDKFIPHYFTTWQKKSLDSYEFKSTFLEFFASDETASKALAEVDWESWFYKPGLPPMPKFDTSMVDKCYALADKWANEKVYISPTRIPIFPPYLLADSLKRRTSNPPHLIFRVGLAIKLSFSLRRFNSSPPRFLLPNRKPWAKHIA